MKIINRNNIIENKIETIAMFESEVTRWFDSHGLDISKNFTKICSVVKNIKDDGDRIASLLTHYSNVGYKVDDLTFVPIYADASGVRKGITTWMNKDIAPEFWKWAMCGLTLQDISGKIAINKYMAYIGLLASASHPVEEDLGFPINIRRVAIIPDAYVTVSGIMDFVHNNGAVDHAVNREVQINAFDGFGISRFDTNTKRGPWIKAFTQKVNWAEICEYARKNTGSTKFIDFWGTERDLRDCDMVLTESCFKAAKLYSSWEQYCDAFEALGHRICVCVKEHAPKLKGMPYQQGQTLQGNDEDVEWFAQHSLNTVSKYQNPNEAVNLLSQYHKAVARVYPALLREVHTARTLQEKYTSKKVDMLGGRIPELGYNAFIAPDLTAFVQHMFGMPITGSLKAGEISCNNCKLGIVDVTRSPHLDNAHVILENVGTMEFAAKDTPTMFLNIFDLTTIRLRCDYDGDHVWYSQVERLLDLINRTYDILQNLPVDWEVAPAPKGCVNKAAIATFISGILKGSEIGLYADALTKMWNNGYRAVVCDWLTYAGNVLIDAAKHAKVKIKKPDGVKEVDNLTLPEFCRYAKADKDHPADSKYWTEPRITKSGKVLPPRTQYTGSFLDKYSRRVKELIPDVLEVNGLDDMVFDSYVMLINPDRKIGKLAGLSKKSRSYDPETGCYEDGGLFQKIAFRHADEWKSLINQDGFKMNHLEWEEAKKNEAIREMITWARQQYADNAQVVAMSDDAILDGIYDIVTRNIFNCKMSEGMDTVVKNAYWRIFGEKCYTVVCDNIGEEALNQDFSDEDDLDE